VEGLPDNYLGFRAAIRVTGDRGTPQVAVFTFPNGIPATVMESTRQLLPSIEAPPSVSYVIGAVVTDVHRNTQTGLRIPPSPFPGGWYIQFGETFLESNIGGLALHSPHAPTIIQ
jgi:hypothetical protein